MSKDTTKTRTGVAKSKGKLNVHFLTNNHYKKYKLNGFRKPKKKKTIKIYIYMYACKIDKKDGS